VKAGNIRSEYLSVTKGIPQGSVLGPVLFTIYINDIASALENCNAHLYADDTVLSCSADTVQLAVENLQLSFTALQNALVDFKVVLNASKTKFMLFSRARGIDFSSLHQSTLNGCYIERVRAQNINTLAFGPMTHLLLNTILKIVSQNSGKNSDSYTETGPVFP